MSSAAIQAAVTQVIVGIVIAVVSSWVTVRMSLKRFRSEKWWERKAAAYERVIEALYQAQAFFEAHLDAAMEGRELTDEFKAELHQHSKDAHIEINKATAIGAFMLSDEAQARLNKYQQEVAEAEKKDQGWESMLDQLSGATNDCLAALIGIARKDLQTK